MDASRESPTSSQHDLSERRILRTRYLAVKNQICGDEQDIGSVDSNKFRSIIGQVENLHKHVHRPREQVSDAETLLDIATSLAAAARSQRNGPTPSDFVDAIIRNFGVPGSNCNDTNYLSKSSWEKIGMSASHIFLTGHGYCTMNGPMNAEVKPLRSVVRRKRTRPTQSSRPEDVGEKEGDPAKKTDTDRNILTMFTILRKIKQAKLEYLVLNRKSFAQTVENIFALSFLVKDGRVQITVDKNGHHLVSPRNAPAATSITSGEVSYNHFVFRFDMKDWKVMRELVPAGEELMPHRSNLVYASLASNGSQVNSGSFNLEKNATQESNVDQANSGCCSSLKYATLVCDNNQVVAGSCEPIPTSTPIKTLTRNRGLVTSEDSATTNSANKSSLDEEVWLRRRKKPMPPK